MKITISAFKGMRPIAASHLLEAGEAQEAVDVDIDGGDLRAAAKPLRLAALAGATAGSLSRWTENANGHWLEFAEDVDVVRGPVADDAYERIYFTGLSEPRFFANDHVSVPFNPAVDFIKLGVPAPAAALAASGYSTGSGYRAYVYTFVNRYGEEGPPSPLLEVSNYASGNVTLTGFSAPATGRAIEFIRVYRTNSSAVELSEFQLVFLTDLKIYSATATYMNGDLVVYNGSFFKCVQNNTTGVTPLGSTAQWDDWYDGISDGDMQPDTLVSQDWEPPPAGLKGLVALPNGSLAGFVGSTVYMCEPGYPHAWPQGSYSDDFTHTQPAPVVAIKVYSGGLMVMTRGPTILLSGSQPDQMAPTKLPGLYPCVSKRSAAESPLGILYAARAGMMMANSDGLAVATLDLLSEKDWADYVPASIHGAFSDGKYIGFYNAQAGFQIDFSRKTFMHTRMYAQAAYAAEDDGILYLAMQDAVDPDNPPDPIPVAVWQWAGSDVELLYMQWKSGLFIWPSFENLGVARVTIDETRIAEIAGLIAENETVVAYNAAIFAAGVDGGLAGSGLGVYGLAGDALRSYQNLSVGNTVTFKWYCNGKLKLSKVIRNSKAFRLPGGFRGGRCEVGLEGYTPVRMVEMATGMEELCQ